MSNREMPPPKGYKVQQTWVETSPYRTVKTLYVNEQGDKIISATEYWHQDDGGRVRHSAEVIPNLEL